MGLASEQVRATVAVSDIGRAAEFYERTLGLAPLDGDDMVGVRIYPCGKGSLLPDVRLGARRYERRDRRQLEREDFESLVDELRANGVRFEAYGEPATDATGTYGDHKVVWFTDPDGNTLAVDNDGGPS